MQGFLKNCLFPIIHPGIFHCLLDHLFLGLPWWLRQYNPPAVWEMWAQSLAWEDHGNPVQYSYLENPHGREEPGWLQSMRSKESSPRIFLSRLPSGFSNYSQWKIWFKVLTVQVCGSLVFKFYFLTTNAKL